MNILTGSLPEAVEIDGEIYDLDTDFRTGIDIMIAFEDDKLSEYEKAVIMVQLLFLKTPTNFIKARAQAIKFLNCGEEENEVGLGGSDGDETERLYSFQKDAKYIYSAIRQSHGIDLESVGYLHWWKFCYMFLDLKEECFFSKMIYYRKQEPRGKLAKEEREYCNSIRDILTLPRQISPEQQEIEEEFMRRLRGD